MLKLLFLAVFATLCGAESPDEYIIGGVVSAKGRWPWQLSLQRRTEDGSGTRHTCGASLISENWAITAAHCVALFSDPDPADYRLLLGAFNQTAGDEEQSVDVARIIAHENFEIFAPGIPNDIAVMELATPADLNNQYISTIKLPPSDRTFAGNPRCYISGWGRNDRETWVASPILNEANVPALDLPECRRRYDDLIDLVPVLDQHICVGDVNHTINACHGDSGGPLHCDVTGNGDWELAGLASRTGPPNCSDFPSVYVRITNFLDWIRTHVQEV